MHPTRAKFGGFNRGNSSQSSDKEKSGKVYNDTIKKKLESLFNNTSPIPDPEKDNALHRMSFVEEITKGPSVSYKRRSHIKAPAELAVHLANLRELIKEVGLPKFCELTFMPEERITGLLKGKSTLDDDLIFHIEASLDKPGYLSKGLGLDDDDFITGEEFLAEKQANEQKIKELEVVQVIENPEENKKVTTLKDSKNHKIVRVSKLKKSETAPSSPPPIQSSRRTSMNSVDPVTTKTRIENIANVLDGRGMKSLLCKAMGYSDSFIAFIRSEKTSFTDDLADKFEKLCGLPSGYLSRANPGSVDESAVRTRLEKAVSLAKAMNIGVTNRQDVVEKVIRSLDGGQGESASVEVKAEAKAKPAKQPKSSVATAGLTVDLSGGVGIQPELAESIKPKASTPAIEKPVEQPKAKQAAQAEEPMAVAKVSSNPVSALHLMQAEYLKDLAARIEAGQVSAEKLRKLSVALMMAES